VQAGEVGAGDLGGGGVGVRDRYPAVGERFGPATAAPPGWATPSRATGGSSRPWHLLQFVSYEGYRRMIGAQLNVTEARHRLARKIFFGQRGELRQHYREGMEDQLGALGLALNAVVLFNTLCIDAAVKQLAADGFPVTDDLVARLSPIQFDHINFYLDTLLSRYGLFRAFGQSSLSKGRRSSGTRRRHP